MEKDGEDGVSPERTVYGIGVLRSEALEVACGAPAVAVMGAGDLVITSEDSSEADGEGIDGGVEDEGELLRGRDGRSVAAEDDVEVRNDAGDALLFSAAT